VTGAKRGTSEFPETILTASCHNRSLDLLKLKNGDYAIVWDSAILVERPFPHDQKTRCIERFWEVAIANGGKRPNGS
jgi:hypothetical protein